MAAPWRVISGRKNEKTGKTFWNRVGVAFKRDNGGFSIVLDSLPLNGEMMIVPPDDEKPAPKQREPGDDEEPYL